MSIVLSYEDALAELEEAGLPLVGENGHRETTCPVCRRTLTVTRRDDGGVTHECVGGCSHARIADELHFAAITRSTKRSLDATAAMSDLRELFNLEDIEVVRATLTGQGSRASAEIELSNGDTMEFESLRELANPTILAAELAACAAVTAPVRKSDALKAVALLRKLAQRNATITDNDLAVDWGTSYLQAMPERDVDLRDQAGRWEAFADMRTMDQARGEDGYGPSAIVLTDHDGQRYVRTGHFYTFVRNRESGASEAKITQRMLRVGWYKRNASGRIKATAPGGLSRAIGWNFFVVPEGWPGSRVHAGGLLVRAREAEPHAVGNHREPVNPREQRRSAQADSSRSRGHRSNGDGS